MLGTKKDRRISPQKELEEQENYAPNIIEQQSNSPQIMMFEQENYKPDIPEQPSAYDRLIEAYESRKRKDDAKDRKYKAREAITGIGDAARSISNLYFTTQDAPNAFDANNSVSEKTRQRTALAKAKHDKDRAEWMNYMLNVAGKKEAAKQAEKNRQDVKDYRNAVLKQNEDRLAFQRDQERLRRDKFELEQQKTKWKQDFEEKKLDQKAQLAKMNDDLKRWSERMKMSRSEIAHTLAGYTIDEYQYFDDKGQLHKVKTRTVYNPKTEQLEAEQSDEITTTTQSKGKSLGINAGKGNNNTNSGKSLGINVKKN